MAVEDTLKAFSQWMSRKCMTLHATSHVFCHLDGHVRFIIGVDVLSSYIVSISKLSTKDTTSNVLGVWF